MFWKNKVNIQKDPSYVINNPIVEILQLYLEKYEDLLEEDKKIIRTTLEMYHCKAKGESYESNT